MNGPGLVQPYAGQNQTSVINVPARIGYRQSGWEEGPWSMIPYAVLYPPGSQTEGQAVVPPPIQKTDLFSAQQTWPM